MGKNIILTESQFESLIKNSICESLNRGELLLEARNLVDNFNLIGNLINLTDPDKFFFVQIIKRWKDNKDKSSAASWKNSAQQNDSYHNRRSGIYRIQLYFLSHVGSSGRSYNLPG